MASRLIFTFRTFPYLSELHEAFPDDHILVLGKLKADLPMLFEAIEQRNVRLILGLAKSGSSTIIEEKAVNRFNNGVISHNGLRQYHLHIPKDAHRFNIRQDGTTSFCNYAAYKLSKFIADRKINMQFTFIHVSQKDIKALPQIFKSR